MKLPLFFFWTRCIYIGPPRTNDKFPYDVDQEDHEIRRGCTGKAIRVTGNQYTFRADGIDAVFNLKRKDLHKAPTV